MTENEIDIFDEDDKDEKYEEYDGFVTELINDFKEAPIINSGLLLLIIWMIFKLWQGI